jgi:transposase
VSRRVIYYWLATGQLTRDLDAADQPLPRHSAPRASKLDAYKGIIAERLGTYSKLSAVRLFDEVRAAGYTSGITQVRDYRRQPRRDSVRGRCGPGVAVERGVSMSVVGGVVGGPRSRISARWWYSAA